MKKHFALSLLSLGLVACQQANTKPDIRVENASLRAPLPGQSTAVAYFDLVNAGGSDVLLNATSNISNRVELHNHIHDGGVMKMRRVDDISIPANNTVSFKSGGLHIMLFDAQDVEPVSVTLDFKNHDDITIQILPSAS